jgi:hypothetical protein
MITAYFDDSKNDNTGNQGGTKMDTSPGKIRAEAL